MDGWILDRNYDTVGLVDSYDSFIWTDRYLGYGDFEIYMPIETFVNNSFYQEYYVSIKNSDKFMIIEDLDIKSNPEIGTKITVTGRSLESLLERRIIWGARTLTGNFQNGIKTLLDESIINPAITKRRIPNFHFQASTDSEITKLDINTQFIGENLYNAVYALCEERGLGFRVLPDYVNLGGFIFELYRGTDRSYDQIEYPYVIFSQKFENLLSSNFFSTTGYLKTSALVAGDGDWGVDKTTVEVGGGEGLDRREIFVEASLSRTDEEGEEITDAAYLELLQSRGYEELAATLITDVFDGEIEMTRQFTYNEDFFLGDIVQVANEYNMEAQSRISELTISDDTQGERIIPTFTTL